MRDSPPPSSVLTYHHYNYRKEIDMTPICDKCFTDFDVTWVSLPGGGKRYTCTNAKKHPSGEDHVWEPPAPEPAKKPSKGGSVSKTGPKKTDDLLVPFEQIVRGLPPMWLEHGVIEHELRVQYPKLFGAHVAEAGHSMLGDGEKTASKHRFNQALKRLVGTGILRKKDAAATGAWRKNEAEVSYYALEPVEPGTPDLKWEQYAIDLGRPAEWTDEDRAEVRRLSGRDVGDEHS